MFNISIVAILCVAVAIFLITRCLTMVLLSKTGGLTMVPLMKYKIPPFHIFAELSRCEASIIRCKLKSQPEEFLAYCMFLQDHQLNDSRLREVVVAENGKIYELGTKDYFLLDELNTQANAATWCIRHKYDSKEFKATFRARAVYSNFMKQMYKKVNTMAVIGIVLLLSLFTTASSAAEQEKTPSELQATPVEHVCIILDDKVVVRVDIMSEQDLQVVNQYILYRRPVTLVSCGAYLESTGA